MDSLSHLSKRTKDEDELKLHLNLDGISTVQLSRKHCSLSPGIFGKLFHHHVRKIQCQMKQTPIVRDIGKLHVIDSSTMSMSITQYPWATFRKTKAGVRLHLRVVVTKDLTVPDKAILLPAKHADRAQMNDLVEIDCRCPLSVWQGIRGLQTIRPVMPWRGQVHHEAEEKRRNWRTLRTSSQFWKPNLPGCGDFPWIRTESDEDEAQSPSNPNKRFRRQSSRNRY